MECQNKSENVYVKHVCIQVHKYMRSRGSAHRGAGEDEEDKYSDNVGDNLKEKEEVEEEEGQYASSRGKRAGGSWRNNVGGGQHRINFFWGGLVLESTIQ